MSYTALNCTPMHSNALYSVVRKSYSCASPYANDTGLEAVTFILLVCGTDKKKVTNKQDVFLFFFYKMGLFQLLFENFEHVWEGANVFKQ